MKIRIRLYKNTSQDPAAIDTIAGPGRSAVQVENTDRPRRHVPASLLAALTASLTTAGGAWLIWPSPVQQPQSAQSRLAEPAAAVAPAIRTSGQDGSAPGAPVPLDLTGFVTTSGPGQPSANAADQTPVRDELAQCQARLEQTSAPENDTQPLAIASRTPAKTRAVGQTARKTKKRHAKAKPKPVERARTPPYSAFWSTRQNDLFLTN